jgi:hypothetical protein
MRTARTAWLWCVFAAGLGLCQTAGAQGTGAGETPLLRAQASLPDAPGFDVARAACSGCHGPALIVGQRLTRAGWDREVAKMERWSRPLPPPDRERQHDNLAPHVGVNRTP